MSIAKILTPLTGGPRDAIVLERGAIVHRARSPDLRQDQATLDRLIGLRLAEDA